MLTEECVGDSWMCTVYHHIWQSRIEIKHYSVACFIHISAFEALYHRTSVKSGAHTHCINYKPMNTWHVFTVHITPTLNGSSALQHSVRNTCACAVSQFLVLTWNEQMNKLCKWRVEYAFSALCLQTLSIHSLRVTTGHMNDAIFLFEVYHQSPWKRWCNSQSKFWL